MQILTEREQGGHTNVRQNKFKVTRDKKGDRISTQKFLNETKP